MTETSASLAPAPSKAAGLGFFERFLHALGRPFAFWPALCSAT